MAGTYSPTQLVQWGAQTKGQLPPNPVSIGPLSPGLAPPTASTNPKDYAGGVVPVGAYADTGPAGAPKPKPAAGNNGLDLNGLLKFLGQGGAPAASGVNSDMVGALHKSYDDQVAAINNLYNTHLAHLDQLHANGVAGVNANGGQLQDALHGLAVDALARQQGVNKGIGQGYAQAGAGNHAEVASMLHDLRSQGADTKGLLDELSAAGTMLNNQKTLQLSDSKGQQGLLQQMLNDRQAEGHQMTTGTLDDMLSALQNAQYNATQDHTTQLGQAQQSLDQGMVSAAAANARANAKANAPLSPSDLLNINKLFGGAQAQTVLPNVGAYFRTNGIRADSALAPIANHYETAISSGQMTPAQAMADWQQNQGAYTSKGGKNTQLIDNALASAQADFGRSLANTKKTTGFNPQALLQYLALRSSGV